MAREVSINGTAAQSFNNLLTIKLLFKFDKKPTVFISINPSLKSD